MAVVRTEGANATTLHYSAYDVLKPDSERYQHCPAMTVDEVIAKIERWKRGTDAYCDRWIAHLDNRLAYERAMLAEAGGLITDRTEYPIVPGGRVLVRAEWLTVIRVNRKDGQIVSVTTNSRYVRVKGIEEVKDYQPPTTEAIKAVKAAKSLPPIVNEDLPGCTHMTKAEFDSRRKHSDFFHYRVVRAAGEFAAYRQPSGWAAGTQTALFFTDQKVKPRPLADETIERVPIQPPERATSDLDEAARLRASNERRAAERAEAAPFDALREAVKAGVQVVSAPALFPTPPELARRVVELAQIGPGMRLLEPSAGTGRLVDEALSRVNGTGCMILVELSVPLYNRLAQKYGQFCGVVQGDFLEYRPGVLFDRVVMNPPFTNGADIRHVQHAAALLKPGGRLVAIVANGPRQQAALGMSCAAWTVLQYEALPAGTFSEQGTNVSTALVVIQK